MVGPNPDSFQRALNHFKQSLATKSSGLANQFTIDNVEDIQAFCLRIQDEPGLNRRMRRIKGFIEAMDQLGQSIEVFVNANELVCFIWVAKTHFDSFDKLLDVYEKVGEAIPGLLAYRSMLEKHPPLATVLEDYYSDVLRFHEAALKVFTRSTALREERQQELRFELLEKHKWRLLHIREKLEATDYQNDQEMITEHRNGSDSGAWITKSPAFVRWTDRSATGHDVLYIHGIPGAGKTTLMSSIIEHLIVENDKSHGNNKTLIAYSYIKHGTPGKDTHNSLLRTIVDQMATRDPVLSDHLFNEMTSVEGVRLRSTKNLESLIATNISSYERSFIVIDGLDEAAPGMFLYARVVLENLLNQTKLSRLKQEMQPDVFPDGMERAYDRVAKWILEDAPECKRQDALKTIGWVICAERPLHWREIQSIFCTDVEAGTFEYEENRLRVECKELCGALVDVRNVYYAQTGPDDVVTIVHDTACEFLLRRQYVKLSLEHAKAATFCFRYLTSKPFLLGTGNDLILQHIRQGYFGFQDYAVQHGLKHFEKAIRLETAVDGQEEFGRSLESTRDYLLEYSLPVPLNITEFLRNDVVQFIEKLPLDERERASKFSITYRTLDIRKQIEALRVQDLPLEDMEVINSVYGHQVAFKCPKIWCVYFATGFGKEQDRCFAFQFGFDNQNKLNEHVSKHHSSPDSQLLFPKTTRMKKNDSLWQAAKRGDLAAVLEILEFGPQFDDSTGEHTNPPDYRFKQFDSRTGKGSLGRDPLYLAAGNGHVEICQILLKRGAGINYDSRWPSPHPPIDIAVEKKMTDVVHLFLSCPELEIEQGSPSLRGWIRQACLTGDLNLFKLLLESPKTAQSICTPVSPMPADEWIINACKGKSIEIVQYLLEGGFSDKVTPEALFIAEEANQWELATLLERILNLPAFSQHRAEQLLRWKGLIMEAEQFKVFQHESPQAQQVIAAQQLDAALQAAVPDQKISMHDYQLQLMLLDQQNKKRLMMARQAADAKELRYKEEER
ncbi:hypothetical protein N0V82_004807 [Gnomoniopsis sp. IMI 355080]|nr:hypothetical protein N0V82_004807 [Gnomoniopsis sp. IMI 355080]